MRVAVFGQQNTPRKHLYAVLDALGEEKGLHVLCWIDHAVGEMASQWADSRAFAAKSEISNVPASAKRHMGRFFDARAAIIVLFKVYAPDRVVIFGSQWWASGGLGRRVLTQAEKWGVPCYLYEPTDDGSVPVGRVVELCGKRSPISKNVCSRFRGHPSAWHWSYRKGERVSKFWLP